MSWFFMITDFLWGTLKKWKSFLYLLEMATSRDGRGMDRRCFRRLDGEVMMVMSVWACLLRLMPWYSGICALLIFVWWWNSENKSLSSSSCCFFASYACLGWMFSEAFEMMALFLVSDFALLTCLMLYDCGLLAPQWWTYSSEGLYLLPLNACPFCAWLRHFFSSSSGLSSLILVIGTLGYVCDALDVFLPSDELTVLRA